MNAFENRQILVAVDGSEAAWSALRHGLELGDGLGCKVVAVTAMQTRLPGYRAGYFSFVDRHVLDELRKHAAAVLQEAVKVAEKHRAAAPAEAGGSPAPLETVAVEGEEEIFELIADLVARTEGVAFLVVGSYSHGLRDRYLLGSTTQRLILEIARRELKVPVIVVP